MRNLIINNIIIKNGYFNIKDPNPYKKGGIAWHRNQQGLDFRDKLDKLSNEELLEMYTSKIEEDVEERYVHDYNLDYYS